MGNGVKLSEAQRRTLGMIADYKPADTRGAPADAPYWNNRTDRALLDAGLIERCDIRRDTMVIHCCRITDAGRSALSTTRREGADG